MGDHSEVYEGLALALCEFTVATLSPYFLHDTERNLYDGRG